MSRLQSLIDKTITVSSITTTDTSAALSMDGVEALSVQVVADVNTPSAKAFTAADTDICTAAAHGFPTGLKGQASNSGGDLPTGLAAVTDYFVISTGTNTFKLAASLVDALAGTAVDITDAGTGTHTFTPTALAGANVRLQKSNSTKDQIDAGTAVWDDEGSATNITADADVWLEKDRPAFKWARVRFTLTAGSLSATSYVLAKGR
jgi:hypothetical protein